MLLRQPLARTAFPQAGQRRHASRVPALAAGVAALLAGAAPLQASILETNFADRWVDSAERLEIRLDDRPELLSARLRVLIGPNDYSGLATLAGPGLLHVDTSIARLPAGNTEVVVYSEGQSGWQEVGRAALRVRTRAGFEESEFSPRLSMTNKSQWLEGHRDQAPAPQRATYHDLAGNFSLQSRHTRGNLELSSRAQVIGSSVRQEALRFGQRFDAAPKVDLADFLVSLRNQNTAFELGQLSVGNHPLLVSYLSSRGFEVSQRAGSRLDFRAAAVAGQQVTGYSRLLGVDFDENQVTLATLGFSPLNNQPDGLRLELSWMDAERPSQSGFNIGQVTDAERSRGLGLRLAAQTPGRRVGGEIAWARSRYVNPEDPLLSFGQALVPVIEESNSAWMATTRIALLQNRRVGDNQYANVSLNANFQRVDPLYRSLGAFVQPDLQQLAVALSGQLGSYSLQLRHSDQEDNLDDIPTVLKTRTRGTTADFSWPLGSLRANPATGRSLWPNLTLRAGRIHQFAANEPISEFSEFNSPSHLPDQVTSQYGLQANWSLGRASLGYAVNFTDQDNRQPGREQADFKSLNHGVNVSWTVGSALSLNLGISRARNAEIERDLARYSDSLNAGLNWRINQRLAFAAAWQGGRNHDSLAQAEGRNRSLNATLSGNVELPMPGRRIPAQLFVAYSRQSSSNENRIFDFDSRFGTWTLNSGLSFTF